MTTVSKCLSSWRKAIEKGKYMEEYAFAKGLEEIRIQPVNEKTIYKGSIHGYNPSKDVGEKPIRCVMTNSGKLTFFI